MFSLLEVIPFIEAIRNYFGLGPVQLWVAIYVILFATLVISIANSGNFAIVFWWPAVLFCSASPFYVLWCISIFLSEPSGALFVIYNLFYSLPIILFLIVLIIYRPRKCWLTPFPYIMLVFNLVLFAGGTYAEWRSNFYKMNISLVNESGLPVSDVKVYAWESSSPYPKGYRYISDNDGKVVMDWEQNKFHKFSFQHPEYGEHRIEHTSKSPDWGTIHVRHVWHIIGGNLGITTTVSNDLPMERDAEITVILKRPEQPPFFRIIAQKGDIWASQELLAQNKIFSPFAPGLAGINSIAGEIVVKSSADDIAVLGSNSYRDLLGLLCSLDSLHKKLSTTELHLYYDKIYRYMNYMDTLQALYLWAGGADDTAEIQKKLVSINRGEMRDELTREIYHLNKHKLEMIKNKIDGLASVAINQLKPFLSVNREAAKSAASLGRFGQMLLPYYPYILRDASPEVKKVLLDNLSNYKLSNEQLISIKNDYSG